MIVDTHVHVWEISDKYPIGPTAPTWNSYPDEPGTAEELLADMDANHVDWTVLVQTSWSTWDNGYIADSTAKYPNRFIGHGMLDPQDPNNAERARYWVKDRGLAGFRFHPMYYPDEKILLTKQNEPLWEEIAALNAVIQFHFRPDFADQVDAIAKRCPNNLFLLDHMGYPKVNEDLSAYQPILDLAQHDNIYFKLSDVKGRSNSPFPYTDVHPYIRAALDAFTPQRTTWGTGYPGHHRVKHNWLSLADELRLIREGLPFLTDAEKERILGGTAAEIWNLK
ncbi:MAG: amidohydrolase family protein [bacterium]|nr:amidohydrolase family protein [bacterium]